MSRLFRAGAGLALGLSLSLFGAAGCGDADEPDATVGPTTAEPGQAAIPGAGASDAGTDGTADVPVTDDPSAPGTGP